LERQLDMEKRATSNDAYDRIADCCGGPEHVNARNKIEMRSAKKQRAAGIAHGKRSGQAANKNRGDKDSVRSQAVLDSDNRETEMPNTSADDVVDVELLQATHKNDDFIDMSSLDLEAEALCKEVSGEGAASGLLSSFPERS